MWTRRFFIRLTLIGAGFVKMGLKLGATDTADDVADGMVDHARSHLRETDWAPKQTLGSVEKRYFCNIFVADVAGEAGGATWDPIQRSGSLLPYPDPLAREWENSSFAIKGWTVVFEAGTDFKNKTAKDVLLERKPGDIVSGLGHVGIVSVVGGDCHGKVISAASEGESTSGCSSAAKATEGAVIENDFSFRFPGQDEFTSAEDWENAAKNNVKKFTVRRFVGVSYPSRETVHG